MKIQSVMTKNVVTCTPQTDLAKATQLMWEADCGALPVIDEAGRLVGIVTDRDICIGVGTRPLAAGHIAAREVMSSPVRACMETDDVAVALSTLQAHRVRRLPVLNQHGHITGIVSMNDIVLHAGHDTRLRTPILDALKAICTPRRDKLVLAASA